MVVNSVSSEYILVLESEKKEKGNYPKEMDGYLELAVEGGLRGKFEDRIMRLASGHSIFKFLWRTIRYPRMEINALFLWATTLATSAAGFLFWNISARLFTANDVGVASSVISLVLLLAGIANLGIGIGIVRFLGNSENRIRMINAALSFTFITSLFVGIVCVIGIDLWSPGLSILRKPDYFTLFILLMISTTHNQFLQMVFLALRRTSATLAMVILLNVIRLGIILSIQMNESPMIITSLASATILSNILAFLLLRRLIPTYWPKVIFSVEILRQLLPYSFAMGLASYFAGVPAIVAPLLALNYLGNASSAFVYIAWMMGSLLLSPGISLSQSAFSEGSSNPENLPAIIHRTIIFGLLITSFLAIIIFCIASWLVGLFGVDYRGADILLRWLCITAPFYSITIIIMSAFRVQKRFLILLSINVIVAAVFIGIQMIFLRKNGLTVMGLAWTIAQTLAVLISLATYGHDKSEHITATSIPADVGTPS